MHPWTPSWNPYSHLPLLLPLFALGFRGREEGVALLSLYGLLSLFLPPLVLALSLPLLASREEWGLLGGLGRPERLFLEATLGIALGLLLPLSAGLALAGGILGLSWTKGVYLWGAGLLLALTFLVVAAWATLSEGRAMAFGLLLWGSWSWGMTSSSPCTWPSATTPSTPSSSPWPSTTPWTSSGWGFCTFWKPPSF